MDFLSIVVLILNVVFVGFGLTIPVFLLFTLKRDSSREEAFVANAVNVLITSGIAYCVIALLENITINFNSLIQPFAYLLLSQLLWIKKLRVNKVVLFIVSILLLLVPSSWYYTLVTTIHSDYLSSNKQKAIQVLLLESFLFVIVFIAIVFAVMFTRRVIRKRKT